MANQTIQRTALAALLLASVPCAEASAQSEMPPSTSAPIQANGPAMVSATDGVHAAKPCVLLQNDNVLFGLAQQVGEYVVIRDGLGGEVRLPRKEVACWAPSVRDLYRYRVDHRTRNDLSTRLRDARWCVRYDLFDLADQELAVIRQHAPNNAEAASIRAQIARARSPQPSEAQVAAAHHHDVAGNVHLVDHQDPVPKPIEIDLPTLRFFAGHVQPTLINRCGNCHSQDSQRPWSMIVPGRGTRASSRITRENLNAALEFVDGTNPENSPLLQKAMTPHGGSETPLDPRHAKSIEALKLWLSVAAQMTTAPDPASTPSDDAAVPADPQRSAAENVAPGLDTPDTAAFEQGTTIRQPLDEMVDGADAHGPDAYLAERPSVGTHPSLADQADGPSPTGPARLPRVSDPFSPDLFNRRHHGAQ
ncbi:hypothetical protein K227x_20980 [Rubripirellula lacrimiformis]|uniref:Cytochrome c domain-containing protein n=1 Tax=Rubripirellula lacrimiformis TaxID=1930273 RepID=A0A517N9A0_9BACT|nr:hypothetical protein [Rubripirellula lacrimiformis]QDT03713.1 hypothetical protein K227x_20980 [Rubripirellula lacrimiformis]